MGKRTVKKPNRPALRVSKEVHAAVVDWAERRNGLKIGRAAEELITLALRVARVPVVGVVADSTTETTKEARRGQAHA